MAVRIGIIGCGGIAHCHAMSYKKLGERCELVACCDIIPERAAEFAKTYGIPHSFGSAREMLSSTELDAVSVCTWNSAHKECTVMALDSGLHVLCEKPLAMNTAEALEMQAAADRAGRLLMVGFVRRHGNDAAAALDYINDGTIGQIYYMRARYIRRAGFPGNWFGDKSYSGGGPLIDLGVHVIDLCRYLAGNPRVESVYGATFDLLGPRDSLKRADLPWQASEMREKPVFNVEDMATALIRFEGGIVLSVEASFSLHTDNGHQSVEIFGSNAGLNLDPFTIHTEVGNRASNIHVYGDVGEGDFFTAEMCNFIDSIEGRAECKAPAADGVELMRILDAVYESAETGRSVEIVR